MAAQNVIRWNAGLALSFLLLILGYFAKLKYASTLTGVQSVKAEEGKNLITLLLTINVVTIIYWRWWPSPYQINPLAR